MGADVGDAAGSGAGTEIDLYAGINFEFMVPMYVGVTGYYYTDNFDRDYEEINIGMDFGLFAIDAVPYGSYKSDGAGTASSDYGHFMVTVPLGMIDYSYMTFTGGSLHYAAQKSAILQLLVALILQQLSVLTMMVELDISKL